MISRLKLKFSNPDFCACASLCSKPLTFYLAFEFTKNLNRVAKPPITGSNWAPAQISKHLLNVPAEPTMLEPRLDTV